MMAAFKLLATRRAKAKSDLRLTIGTSLCSSFKSPTTRLFNFSRRRSWFVSMKQHVIDLDVVGLDVPSEIISIEQYDWLSDLISDIAFLDCNIVVFKNGIRSSWCLR